MGAGNADPADSKKETAASYYATTPPLTKDRSVELLSFLAETEQLVKTNYF